MTSPSRLCTSWYGMPQTIGHIKALAKCRKYFCKYLRYFYPLQKRKYKWNHNPGYSPPDVECHRQLINHQQQEEGRNRCWGKEGQNTQVSELKYFSDKTCNLITCLIQFNI